MTRRTSDVVAERTRSSTLWSNGAGNSVYHSNPAADGVPERTADFAEFVMRV